jgi:hypothetical protein
LTTTSDAGLPAEILEARRVRLETLLQVASREFDLKLALGEVDRVGGGRIAMRFDAREAMAASYLALKGGGLHLLGHYLSESEAALAAALTEEEGGRPHFVALWHALEDARLENGMLRRWPGMGRAFEARLLPALGGSLLRLAPLSQQLEIASTEGRGRPTENLRDVVLAALRKSTSWIAEGAQSDRPEGSLAAMRAIYPEVAGLLRGAGRRGRRRATDDPSADTLPERRPARPAQDPPTESGSPEIDIGDDLASASLLGRRRELPDWYRPGSAPWFERSARRRSIPAFSAPMHRRSSARAGDLAPTPLCGGSAARGRPFGAWLVNLLAETAFGLAVYRSIATKLWKQRLGSTGRSSGLFKEAEAPLSAS